MSPLQTSDINLAELYSDLQTLFQTLQTKHSLRSFTQQTPPTTPSFYTFFLTPLPLLLTSQKEHAIYNLRNAYLYVTHLSSFEEQSVRERYNNFGRALVWALDHADDLLRPIRDVGELEIMKAIRTIFHLVASLCYREWDIDQPSVHHPHQVIDASPNNTVPSIQDPVYHPPSRARSKSAGNSLIIGDVSEQANHVEQVGTNLHHVYHTIFPHPANNIIDDEIPIPAIQPLSIDSRSHQLTEMEQFNNSVQNDNTSHENDNAENFPLLSNYIRSNGKQILLDACIKETADGCHVPFDLIMRDNREEDISGIFGHLTCHVGVSYPDNTCFSHIPVHGIRLLNCLITNGFFTEQDNFNAVASVEINTNVYNTLINRLKEAYFTRFPDRLSIFFTDFDLQHAVPDRSVEIKIPVLSNCFARVVHLSLFVEHPLWEVLEMCQHEVSGCGLLQAELVEGAEGITIVISLAGVIVERNLLNYGESIFEVLDTGVVSEI